MWLFTKIGWINTHPTGTTYAKYFVFMKIDINKYHFSNFRTRSLCHNTKLANWHYVPPCSKQASHFYNILILLMQNITIKMFVNNIHTSFGVLWPSLRNLLHPYLPCNFEIMAFLVICISDGSSTANAGKLITDKSPLSSSFELDSLGSIDCKIIYKHYLNIAVIKYEISSSWIMSTSDYWRN